MRESQVATSMGQFRTPSRTVVARSLSVTLDAALTFSIMITRDHLDDAIDANIAVREAVRRSVAALRGLGLFACAERRIRLTVAKRAGPAITVVIWRLSIANDVGVFVVVAVRVAFKIVREAPVKVAVRDVPRERVRAVRRENFHTARRAPREREADFGFMHFPCRETRRGAPRSRVASRAITGHP